MNEELEIKRSAVRRYLTYGAGLAYFGSLLGMVGSAIYSNDIETAKWAVGVLGGPGLLIVGFWFGKRQETPS